MTSTVPIVLYKCPCCEKMLRKESEALCPECWRAAPERNRRAYGRTYRQWREHAITVRELARALNELAASAKAQLERALDS